MALVAARPIMDLAFHAALNELDMSVQLDDANVLTNAQRHAKRVGAMEFIGIIRGMMAVPVDAPSPMLDAHLGVDAFDQIAIDAEREEMKKQALQPTKKLKK